jgi:hypothetical protein
MGISRQTEQTEPAEVAAALASHGAAGFEVEEGGPTVRTAEGEDLIYDVHPQ